MAFLGQDGFQWGIGVVEDRFDPEKLGRVRVRWLGLHDDDKQKILTKDLPWSQVMQPVSAGAMAGVGDSPTNLVEGTWVVGFAKEDTLQEWIIMGTLPGNNTRTSFAGKLNRKWAKQRGMLQKYTKEYSSEIPDASEDYLDYEHGFQDPTIDQRNIPYPPSDVTIGHSQKFGDYSAGPGEHYPELHESSIETPQSYYVNSPGAACGVTKSKHDMIPEDFPDDKYEKTQRVPNYKPAGLAPNDLDECDDEKWMVLPELKGYAPKFARLTHSDILHYLYRTTRRVTADLRQCDWTHFGTFAWPDVQTYGYRAHLGVNLSTGYLEDGHWRADKEAGSPGGTHAPTWPITRDTPTSSTDSAGLAGIDPLDNRASWGQESGQEIGYFCLDGEEFRLTHPRTPYVQKGKLATTQRQEVKELFDDGHYGTGIYNVSDPKGPDTRKDIKFADVKETDLVVLPESDTNRLAEGGIPIKSITDSKVVTRSSLWGDSTTTFATAKENKNKNTKPKVQKGDVIMISGCRGSEEYNGRVYRIMDVSSSGSGFTITLGTMDGIPWSGPGSIEYSGPESTTPSIVDAVELKKEYTAEYSAYLGGGIISINPHWMVRAKAETRERQINIGNPEMNTGINFRFWNQPTSRWASQYPFNHVYESESGHIKEFDDTPGAERIHEYHRSGTYYEVDHQGTKVDYVKGDNYNIRIFDDYLYVKGKVAWTFDDEVWIRANDRMDISAKWKIQIHSGGDLDLSSKRNINMKASGDINMQYDGHMNILGTALDPASAKYHAGTRPCKELSNFNLKTGHIQVQAIENIKIQADISEITIKALTDSIYLTAGTDIHEFTYGDNYTTAQGSINEYSVMWNARTSMMNVEDLSIGGDVSIYASAGEIKAEALTGDIKIIADAAQVRISALSDDIQMFAADDIMMYATDDIIAYANDDVMITGKERVDIKALDTVINIEAKTDINVKSLDENIFLQAASKSIHVKSQTSLYLQSVTSNVYSHAAISHYVESTLDFYNLAGGNIIETATEIHMNGPEALWSALADPADTAVQATEAQALAPSWPTPALMSSMAPTIDVLPIDIPDPAPASGIGLGLNANDPGSPGGGYGGENIRVTHDTINDIIAGKSNTAW